MKKLCSLSIIIFLEIYFSFFLFGQKNLSSSSEGSNDKLQEYLKKADFQKYLNEDSCLYYCDLAFPLCVETKNIEAEIEINIFKSEIYKLRGDFERAMDLGLRAKELSELSSQRRYYADAIRNIAAIYLELGILDISFDHYNKALKIYNTQKYNLGIAKTYNGLGVLQAKQEQYKEALNYFVKAQEYALKSEDKCFNIQVLGNLSLLYMLQGNISKAENALFESIKQIQNKKLPYNLTKLQLNLTRVYLQNGNYSKAVTYGEKALYEAQKSQNKLLEARSLYYLGYAYFIQIKNQEAIHYFTLANEIAKNLSLIDISTQIYGHFAVLYEELGDYKKAYTYSKLYKEGNDSINITNNSTNLTRLNFEYIYKEEVLKNKFYYNRRALIFTLISVFFALIILGFWLLYTRQKLKLKNTQVEQYKLSQELELRNKEIATKTIYLQQKNELILDIADKLLKSKYSFKTQNQPLIEESVKVLRQSANDNSWEEFELRFENVHMAFFKKLKELYPNLTQNDKKICAYLRLNMTTKEIAILTNTTVGGVEQARFRLRKKLGLHNAETDLANFIESI